MVEARAGILPCSQPSRNHPHLLHHHAPYSLRRERKRSLTWLIRLDLELLMVVQHVDEPLVGFMACGEAV